MDKKRTLIISLIILAVVLIIATVVFGYSYYQKSHKAVETDAVQQAGDTAENLGKSASQGVLPSIDPKSNPMENAPDINPVSKTNPFSSIKTNPF